MSMLAFAFKDVATSVTVVTLSACILILYDPPCNESATLTPTAESTRNYPGIPSQSRNENNQADHRESHAIAHHLHTVQIIKHGIIHAFLFHHHDNEIEIFKTLLILLSF
jgi:hypothetical protein